MDPEDGPEISAAPQIEPSGFASGFYLGVTAGEVGAEMAFRLIPAASVAGLLAMAGTAVQPGALGSAAFMDAADLADFVSVQLGGLEALLAQINGPA